MGSRLERSGLLQDVLEPLSERGGGALRGNDPGERGVESLGHRQGQVLVLGG